MSCGPAGCFAAGDPQLARQRAGVRAFLHDVSPERLADAVQVVDELTSNAARHGSPPIRLQLTRRETGRILRVTVYDGSPQLPRLDPAASPGALHLGMRMIDALCTIWGVVRGAEGKLVWAELPLTERASP